MTCAIVILKKRRGRNQRNFYVLNEYDSVVKKQDKNRNTSIRENHGQVSVQTGSTPLESVYQHEEENKYRVSKKKRPIPLPPQRSTCTVSNRVDEPYYTVMDEYM